MIGIVLLHIIGPGGVLSTEKGNYSLTYWAAEWVLICSYCSVDIFAMMSGFFGINKKSGSIIRTMELIAIVLFYSVIITLGFIAFAPAKITGFKFILEGIFPSFFGHYWYITCFIPILIFQPFINKMLWALSEKQHFVLILMEIIVFSCIPSLVRVDFFRFGSNGRSFAWLLSLYSVGAYLGRSKDNRFCKSPPKNSILLFFILSFVLLFGNIYISKIAGTNLKYMVANTSPLVLAMGLSIMLALSNIKLSAGGKVLKVLSSTAFDVYIIHSHVMIYNLVLSGAFAWIKDLAWYFAPVVCVVCAISVFLLCSVLGYIRIQLFSILRINALLYKLSDKIDKLLYSW